MPKARAGKFVQVPLVTTEYLISALGVLIECDPSIKAIIMKIDREQQHRIVMEEIDDEHVLIQNDKHDELKELLKNVSGLLQSLTLFMSARLWT